MLFLIRTGAAVFFSSRTTLGAVANSSAAVTVGREFGTLVFTSNFADAVGDELERAALTFDFGAMTVAGPGGLDSAAAAHDDDLGAGGFISIGGGFIFIGGGFIFIGGF